MNKKQKIEEILLTDFGCFDDFTVDKLLDLFAISKRHLLESILEDMDGKHPEYHREVVESYLDDGC